MLELEYDCDNPSINVESRTSSRYWKLDNIFVQTCEVGIAALGNICTIS